MSPIILSMKLFEKFLNTPSNEYELFTKISHEISENYTDFFGQWIYIHLSKAGENISVADEIKSSEDPYEIGHHLYIDRDKQACILIRTDKTTMTMLLYGEFDWAEHMIRPNNVQVLIPRGDTSLPFARACPMTAVEMMQAFGHISDSLQQTKRNKAS
jgi:hypothetical protein